MQILAAPFYGVSGDYQSIATTTVGAGGQTTITFSSIPSTYKHLQIRLTGRATGAYNYASVYVRFNSDSNSNYSYHQLYTDGATSGSSSNNTVSYMLGQNISAASSSANFFGVMIFDILEYANTDKYKTIKQIGGVDRNGSGYVDFNSGHWRSTSAVSTITLTTDGDFAQYSHVALYGIRG
jgi:hypothetical protein